MAAAALARAVRREDWSIAVLHDDRDTGSLPCGDADGTLPLTQSSHFALETDEDAVVAETGGAFTYGIAFSGWSGQALVAAQACIRG